MIDLTDMKIDEPAVLDSVKSPLAGAAVLFVGTTREFTDGKRTVWLDYEAYEAMARGELQRLRELAMARWPLRDVAIVHRLGEVPIGETSVAIAVSSAHRGPAFEAGQWLIDRLKESVPIWKRERWSDGSSEWIHPEPLG
ncbi:MAG: molybdenum cofactor biosynthesis protein MoaE [Planctomycetales bacterium]|nr:molybdenum cofactor biosynthesis protein MoaE [Planctomycetales bacterium]